MAVFLEENGNNLNLQLADIERAKHNFQWKANAAIAANPDSEKRYVWFVRRAGGTSVVITIKGKIVVPATTGLIDFHDDGLRLGHEDWSITGTVTDVMGYRVLVK